MARRPRPTSMGRYRREDVEPYLDELTSALDAAEGRVAQQADEVERLRDELRRSQELQRALEDTLRVARSTAEDMRANARREGELAVREARQRARHVLAGAFAEKQRLETAVEELRRAEQDIRRRLRLLAEEAIALTDAPLPPVEATLSAVAELTEALAAVPAVPGLDDATDGALDEVVRLAAETAADGADASFEDLATEATAPDGDEPRHDPDDAVGDATGADADEAVDDDENGTGSPDGDGLAASAEAIGATQADGGSDEDTGTIRVADVEAGLAAGAAAVGGGATPAAAQRGAAEPASTRDLESEPVGRQGGGLVDLLPESDPFADVRFEPSGDQARRFDW